MHVNRVAEIAFSERAKRRPLLLLSVFAELMYVCVCVAAQDVCGMRALLHLIEPCWMVFN